MVGGEARVRECCWMLAWMGCTGAVPADEEDTDTDPPVVDCSNAGAAELQFGQELATAPMADQDPIHIGSPPQGGAPFAPFELRLAAELEDLERLDVRGEIHAEDGELLGDIVESKAFLCANTGPHRGYRYGGELHVRFWGRDLVDLDALPGEVTVRLTLPDGTEVQTTHTGTLAWTLDGPREDAGGVDGGDRVP